eukprot:74606_1
MSLVFILCLMSYMIYIYDVCEGVVLKGEVYSSGKIETAPNTEGNEFREYLTRQNVPNTVIQKLINGGLISFDIFEAIKDEELEQLAQELELTVIQKAHIRTIKQKNDKIIDKEETAAMIKLKKKINSINDTIRALANAQNKLNDEVIKQKDLIEQTFGNLENQLSERKSYLLQYIDAIAANRTKEINEETSRLQQYYTSSIDRQNDCRKMISTPIELTNIESRKSKILAMTKEVNDIPIICNNESLNGSWKIDTHFDIQSITNAVNSLGVFELDDFEIRCPVKWRKFYPSWNSTSSCFEMDSSNILRKVCKNCWHPGYHSIVLNHSMVYPNKYRFLFQLSIHDIGKPRLGIGIVSSKSSNVTTWLGKNKFSFGWYYGTELWHNFHSIKKYGAEMYWKTGDEIEMIV